MRFLVLGLAVFSLLFGTVACSSDGPSAANSQPAEPVGEGQDRCFACYKPFPKAELDNSTGELLCRECAAK